MSTLDLKAHLEATTRNICRRIVNDLKAVPADQQNVSPGGCARPPLNVVAECAMVNGFIADFLTTNEVPARPDAETRDRFLASFDTEEKTLTYFEEQAEKLYAAFQTLETETLGETTDALFGRPMTRLAVAEMPAMHMSYHDGQLNYVHSLCGDAQMHWG
ncbi:MAG: hypothetical protein V4671_24530 [Armatimonadota bacterium]